MENSRGPTVASIDTYKTNRVWKMLLPPVYRYLPTEFVDRFFEDGSIRLSTVRAFRKHADEARGDAAEGDAVLVANGGGKTMMAWVGHSVDAYIHCGSQILSQGIQQQFSGAESVFEITNVSEFGLEIARQLVGFQWGVSGLCIYSSFLTREMPHEPFPLPADGGDIPMDQTFAAVGAAALYEDQFLKAPRFANQAEYRLIWNVDSAPNDFIEIKAPQARQFCRRVTVPGSDKQSERNAVARAKQTPE